MELDRLPDKIKNQHARYETQPVDADDRGWLHLAIESAGMAAYVQDLKTDTILRHYQSSEGKFIDIQTNAWTYQDALNNVHPEDRQRVDFKLKESVFKRQPFQFEFRSLPKLGKIRWLQSNGQPTFDEKGQPLQLISVLQDITDRKAAEDELQRKAQEVAVAKENLALTLNLAGMVAIPGLDFEVGFKCPDFCKLLGLQEDTVITLEKFLGQVHPDDREALLRKIESNKNGQGAFENQYRVVWPDGQVHWIMTRGSLVKDGQRFRRYLVVQDITKIKENEWQIEQKSQALFAINAKLERFSSIVAHDLKGPLNSISMAADLIGEANSLAEATEFSPFIRDGVSRMTNLINDLLLFARTDNEDTLAKEFVPLQDVIDVVELNLKSSIQLSQAHIEIEGTLPTLWCRRSQINQLLQNLIANALKFRGSESPKLKIDVKDTGSHWQIAIADNGVGIKPEHLQKMFVPFSRLHGNRFEGTGLGLSICKKIVEQHGGEIWVESTPERGSKFSFTISKS